MQVLARMGIEYTEDTVYFSDKEILAIRKCGDTTLEEIRVITYELVRHDKYIIDYREDASDWSYVLCRVIREQIEKEIRDKDEFKANVDKRHPRQMTPEHSAKMQAARRENGRN